MLETEYLKMLENEYLTMFSNEGKIRVCVKFKDFDGMIAKRTMQAEEIARLVLPDSGEFMKSMLFDDWPFEIMKYVIEPQKNTLTIHARKI